MKLVATGAKVNDHEHIFVDPEQDDAWEFWTSRGYVPESGETVEEVEEALATESEPVTAEGEPEPEAEAGVEKAESAPVVEEEEVQAADENEGEPVTAESEDDEEDEEDAQEPDNDLLSVDLESMTVKELQAFVDDHDIDVSLSSHPLKKEKIAAVREALTAR